MKRACFCLKPRAASILVFTLWVLAFFSILSVSVWRMVYSQLNLGRAFEERMVSPYLARAACLYFQQQHKIEGSSYESLRACRQKTTRQLGRLSFTYTYMDEESKIDINTATSSMIARLPGFDSPLASAVVNSSLKPFQLKEELLSVDGMTREIFDKCKEHISVQSAGWIDVNTAGETVLAAAGLDTSLCEAIRGYRAGPDGKEATDDDRVFESSSQILPMLRGYGGISSSQEALLQDIISRGLLEARGRNYCLAVETVVSGRPAMHYRIWLDEKSVLRWEES